MAKRADVIARLKRGERVVCVMEEGKGRVHLSEGGAIHPATFAKLEDEGQIAPVSRGLFPDAEPQEWEWADV